ncbi:MarR family winged helix-turn-helix transcriptional regulator [Rhizobium leguminosarum]|jgi:DNA-binding MarR family transcriptional regulator|uniref:MarR family winged helix-turn-helix transcriptional regulator n=1 Tax=Rhizobium leguminosarum TaxID=384 RepID=UPI001032581E|nr:MarR family transcriptional regulator [Rhizobium leguminosarum]
MGKKLSIGGPGEELRAGRLSPPELLAELVCTNTALRRASRRLGQIYDDAVAPTGLKATQVGLLTQIAASHEGSHGWPTLLSLAERVAVSISALTHALRPLVRDGLIELMPDEHDGRTKHAMLTTSGEQRLHEALALWADANQRVEVVLGPSAAALRALADDVASPEFLEAYEARRILRG